MVRVGLTGGIASGKSTVSQILKEAGGFIIDADQIAHSSLKKGQPAYRSVLDVFGVSILDPQDGEIHRKKLGDIVFRNPAKRLILNQIVHPFVMEVAEAEMESIASNHPHAVIVFDAPLLIEAKIHLKMDMVLLVYVDEATQVKRLCKRDGFSRVEAEARIRAQMPLDAKIPFANEVINNSKSPQEVRQDVLDIYKMLCTAASL